MKLLRYVFFLLTLFLGLTLLFNRLGVAHSISVVLFILLLISVFAYGLD